MCQLCGVRSLLPPVNKNDGFIIVSCLSPAQAKAPAHGAGLSVGQMIKVSKALNALTR